MNIPIALITECNISKRIGNILYINKELLWILAKNDVVYILEKNQNKNRYKIINKFRNAIEVESVK